MNRTPARAPSTPVTAGVALPEDQRAQQRRRNALSVRIAVIRNGYLLTYGDTGEAEAAAGDDSRAEMHRLLDAFLDRIEGQLADGTLVMPEPSPVNPSAAKAAKDLSIPEYGTVVTGSQFRRVRGEG